VLASAQRLRLQIRSKFSMQSSMFNLRVPLTARDEVFLMNTITDAQLVVSTDVAELLDRMSSRTVTTDELDAEAREALGLLA